MLSFSFIYLNSNWWSNVNFNLNIVKRLSRLLHRNVDHHRCYRGLHRHGVQLYVQFSRMKWNFNFFLLTLILGITHTYAKLLLCLENCNTLLFTENSRPLDTILCPPPPCSRLVRQSYVTKCLYFNMQVSNTIISML